MSDSSILQQTRIIAMVADMLSVHSGVHHTSMTMREN